ncbi:MAG TPA: squalene--hopene cyclase, partial [Actinomycetes bacterium]
MTVTAGKRAGLGAETALERGVRRLLELQHGDGWWKGELETNVTMDAEDLLLREFLGIRTPERTSRAAAWIRSKQRDDGTWATFHGGPPELSTTIEAYVALRLAGDPEDAAHLRRAAEWIRGHGGVERGRVFTRIWLALFGLWDWEDLPVMPPEMILLPSWAPLNVYDFACWARQTIVPLTIVSALRPVRPIGFGLSELRAGARATKPAPITTWDGRFQRLDRFLHRYHHRPVRPLRTLAIRRATRWIIERQEADGSWGGIQPPWVYSIMALHLLGYPLDHPVLETGLRGLESFTVHDGDHIWLEACQSPVWDTGLAVTALADAGLAGDHPALVRAGEWLLGEEVRRRGDWAVRRPDLAPGGWAFEFANDNYPDIDDTAEVILALRRVRASAGDPARKAAISRGLTWITGMVSADGGWAAFDADNTSQMIAKLPFCDFGAVTDPPSADVTAHVVEMLAAEGMADSEAARRGVRWLLDHQERDGSWFGRWGANHVYGTGAVVP